MEILFLGTSSGLISQDRHFSSIAVRKTDSWHLLDAGEGVARQCQKFGIEPELIASCSITHTHPDHAAGIVSLLQWMHLQKRTRPLRLFVPGDPRWLSEKVLPWFQIYPERLGFEVSFGEVKPGCFFEEDLRIEAFESGHLARYKVFSDQTGTGCGSFSFYISGNENGSLLYTSDVESLDHLVGIKSADVLITEITHVDANMIWDFAERLKPGRIILTHIPPERDPVPKEFLDALSSFQVDVAFDGYRIGIKPE